MKKLITKYSLLGALEDYESTLINMDSYIEKFSCIVDELYKISKDSSLASLDDDVPNIEEAIINESIKKIIIIFNAFEETLRTLERLPLPKYKKNIILKENNMTKDNIILKENNMTKDNIILKENNMTKDNIPDNLLDNIIQDSKKFVTDFKALDLENKALPFLSIVCSQSSVMDVTGEKYNSQAKSTDIYFAPTQELISGKEGIEAIPLYIYNYKIEKKDKKTFINHSLGSKVVKTAIQSSNPKTPYLYVTKEDGNMLLEAVAYFILFKAKGSNDKWREGIITLKSTGIKTAKIWAAKIRGARVLIKDEAINPPLFYYQYDLTVDIDKTDDGSAYNKWRIGGAKLIDRETYSLAKETRKFIEREKERLLTLDEAIPVSEYNDTPM